MARCKMNQHFGPTPARHKAAIGSLNLGSSVKINVKSYKQSSAKETQETLLNLDQTIKSAIFKQ